VPLASAPLLKYLGLSLRLATKLYVCKQLKRTQLLQRPVAEYSECFLEISQLFQKSKVTTHKEIAWWFKATFRRVHVPAEFTLSVCHSVCNQATNCGDVRFE